MPFPERRFGRAEDFFEAYRTELGRAAETIDPERVMWAAKVLDAAFQRDATVFACGNGGSAAIANHLQCDHVKGVRNGTELCTRVVSLNSNVELLTAIANDIGYDHVFRYQLESHARPGDVLVVVSSSGNSPNVVSALQWANMHELTTIGITGFDGGKAAALSEISIHVASDNYGVVEDVHQSVMHALAEYIRQSHMSDEAVIKHTF